MILRVGREPRRWSCPQSTDSFVRRRAPRYARFSRGWPATAATRLRHYRQRTENAHLGWILRYLVPGL